MSNAEGAAKSLPTDDCTEGLHTRYRGGCYHCCDRCNVDEHVCHGCGQPLKHDGSESRQPAGTKHVCK